MRSTRARRAGSPRVLCASAWTTGAGRLCAVTCAVGAGVGVAVAGAVASMAREVDGLWKWKTVNRSLAWVEIQNS